MASIKVVPPTIPTGRPLVQPDLQGAVFRSQVEAALSRGRACREAAKRALSYFRSYIGLKSCQAGWQESGRALLPAALQSHRGAVRVAAGFARNQVTAQVLEGLGLSDIARRLGACGSEVIVLPGGVAKAYGPCDLRLLCPICARRDAQRKRRRYVSRVVKVMSDGGYVPALLTLTVKASPDLGQGVSCLVGAFREAVAAARFDRRDKGSRETERSEFSAIGGGVASVEVKRGEGSGLWHPHLHCLCLLSRWVDHGKMKAEWEQRTGGSYVVDIRCLSRRRSMLKQLCEVLKYAVKFADQPGPDSAETWRVLRGVRLFQSWGCLYGIKVEPDQHQGDTTAEQGGAAVVVRFDREGQAFVGGE